MYSGSWGDMEGIIKCQIEEVPHYDLGVELEPRKESASFNRPTKGTSMEKFKEMVFSHLKVSNAMQLCNIIFAYLFCALTFLALGIKFLE